MQLGTNESQLGTSESLLGDELVYGIANGSWIYNYLARVYDPPVGDNLPELVIDLTTPIAIYNSDFDNESDVIPYKGKLYMLGLIEDGFSGEWTGFIIRRFNTDGTFDEDIATFLDTEHYWSVAFAIDEFGRFFVVTQPDDRNAEPPTFHLWRLNHDGTLDIDIAFQPPGTETGGDGFILAQNMYYGDDPPNMDGFDVTADGTIMYFGGGGEGFFYLDEEGNTGQFGPLGYISGDGFSSAAWQGDYICVDRVTGNIYASYGYSYHNGPTHEDNEIYEEEFVVRYIFNSSRSPISTQSIRWKYTYWDSTPGISVTVMDEPRYFGWTHTYDPFRKGVWSVNAFVDQPIGFTTYTIEWKLWQGTEVIETHTATTNDSSYSNFFRVFNNVIHPGVIKVAIDGTQEYFVGTTI